MNYIISERTSGVLETVETDIMKHLGQLEKVEQIILNQFINRKKGKVNT